MSNRTALLCGLGLCGEGLIADRLQRWLLWEGTRTQQVVICSKADLAEPISDGSSTSVVTRLGKSKKALLHYSSWEREVRICERNSADTTSREGGGGGTPGAGAEIFLQPMVMTMVETVELQVIPSGSWKPTVEQTPTCRHWGGLGRSRSSGQDLWLPKGCMMEQLLKDYPLWKGSALGHFQELLPVGRTHTGQVCEGLSPMRGTSRWSRGRVWRERNGREQALGTNNNPYSRVNLCLGRREGIGRKCFLDFFLICHYPTLINW